MPDSMNIRMHLCRTSSPEPDVILSHLRIYDRTGLRLQRPQLFLVFSSENSSEDAGER